VGRTNNLTPGDAPIARYRGTRWYANNGVLWNVDERTGRQKPLRLDQAADRLQFLVETLSAMKRGDRTHGVLADPQAATDFVNDGGQVILRALAQQERLQTATRPMVISDYAGDARPTLIVDGGAA
jgi:hypothetical protein